MDSDINFLITQLNTNKKQVKEEFLLHLNIFLKALVLSHIWHDVIFVSFGEIIHF